MLDSVIDRLAKEWAVISQAPVSFLIASVLVATVVWIALRWQFGSQLSSRDSILALRDAEINDYKRKLDGASPDEAKRRLDELELRVIALSPRRLAKEEADKLERHLGTARGSIDIAHDASAGDAKAFTGDLAIAFQKAGWTVGLPTVLGIGRHPPSGLAMRVYDENNLRSAERAVSSALTAAGIPHDVQGVRQPRPPRPKRPEGMPPSPIPEMQGPDVELLVTSRL